ncbi:hypothetical protein LINGRAHAP2_LOCUS1947 [Linum grandiflorum]
MRLPFSRRRPHVSLLSVIVHWWLSSVMVANLDINGSVLLLLFIEVWTWDCSSFYSYNFWNFLASVHLCFAMADVPDDAMFSFSTAAVAVGRNPSATSLIPRFFFPEPKPARLIQATLSSMGSCVL